jgi:hypothetical protein
MKDVNRLVPTLGSSGGSSVLEAWERFVGGDDHVRGVRPEVVISWHRCREKYRVDPHLTEAPVAVAAVDHTLEHDVIFAELGGLAVSAAREVESLSGIVTVTDASGRILAAWGDHATLARANDAHLAPWYCWSECAAGNQRDGHRAGSARPRAGQRTGALVRSVPRLGLRRRRGARRRDEGPHRGAERVLLAHPTAGVGGRLVGERGDPHPQHVEAARPGQRRRAGRPRSPRPRATPVARSPRWTRQARS